MHAIRPAVLTTTVAFTTIGHITADVPTTPTAVAFLIAISAAYHVGIYLMNDLVDVELDRTDPRRVDKPVASGRISLASVRRVVVVAFAAGAALVVLSDGFGLALVIYLAAVAAGAAYDLYGKRCAVPPLLDFIQGLAWAGLVLLGGALAGQVRLSTLLLAGAVAFFITSINGLQGALRDYRNDSRHGASTTAVYFLGPWRPGLRTLPARYVVYGAAVHSARTVLVISGILRFSAEVAYPSTGPLLAAVVALELSAALCIGVPLASHHESHRAWVFGFVYIPLSVSTLLTTAWVAFGPAAFAVLCCAYLFPWAASRTARSLHSGKPRWRSD